MKYWVVYHTWKNPSSLLARLTSSMICDLWLGWCRDDISITGITVEGWIVRALEFGRWNGGRMYCLGTQAAPIWESSKTAVKESEVCSLFPSISIINVFLGLLLLLLLGHIRVSTSSPIYTFHSSLNDFPTIFPLITCNADIYYECGLLGWDFCSCLHFGRMQSVRWAIYIE